MIQHFSAHPETQVSVMMENNEIMAKYRHKGSFISKNIQIRSRNQTVSETKRDQLSNENDSVASRLISVATRLIVVFLSQFRPNR
jgi:hypothetical protein